MYQNFDLLRAVVNFMAYFVPSLSTIMEPLSQLLKCDQEWTWDVQQEDALAAVKNAMTKSTALAFYGHNKLTKLSTDASSYCLGAVNIARDWWWIPTRWICITHSNECRKTLRTDRKRIIRCSLGMWTVLVILRGLDKFIIETDHKPLIPIINVKGLDRTPIRCQQLLIRLMRYNGIAQFSPGKTLILTDLLSQNPLELDNDKDLENEVQFYVHAIRSGIPGVKEKIQMIQEESRKDSLILSSNKIDVGRMAKCASSTSRFMRTISCTRKFECRRWLVDVRQ